MAGLFVAWGLGNQQWNADTLARRAADNGYAWLALELDDYGNAARWPAFRDSCIAHGVLPGIWVTQGGNIVHTPFDARFAIAEIEGESDYWGVRLAIDNDALPDCPLATVTNFGGMIVKDASGITDIGASYARARPLIRAGFDCLPELYLRTDDGRPTGMTAESLDFVARVHLGFPRTAPVFGFFGGATLTDYSEWFDWPGWSGYLAEHVL